MYAAPANYAEPGGGWPTRGKDDDSDDSNDLPDADLELGKSLLSCLAAYTFLGGVKAVQQSGGLLQLLVTRRHVQPVLSSAGRSHGVSLGVRLCEVIRCGWLGRSPAP